MVAFFMACLILLALTIDLFVQRRVFRAELARRIAHPMAALDLLLVPEGAQLSPLHAWVRGVARDRFQMGTDGLAAILLGRPERVELPRVGQRLVRGEQYAVLHRGGRALPLRSAVDGVVTAVNHGLARSPEEIASAPFGAGWMVEVQAEPARGLMLGDAARQWLRTEMDRLRDALVALAETPEPVGVTALDGGVPAQGAGEALDDAAFARVATQFFGGER